MVEHASKIAHISALVFRVMGVGIGFDTDQISGMRDAGNVSEEDAKLVTMHELLGLAVGEFENNAYAHPMAIFIKEGYCPAPSGASRPIGMVVEEPEEIVDIPLAMLRPMPQLLAPRGDLNGFWSVALMPNEMIFMLDVRKLIDQKLGDVRWTGEKQVAGGKAAGV